MLWVGRVWLALLALAPTASAQTTFDSWTTESGLPQNSVNDIIQTRDGHLWLATFGGLVRFDGARFVVFDRTTEGIASQRIKSLLEDRQGTLWASTGEGMLIRYRAGRFTTFGAKHGLPVTDPIRLEEDDEGDVWVTGPEVVAEFDGQSATTYDADDFGGRVGVPRIAMPNEVWWGHDEDGLHLLLKGRVKTYDVRREIFGAAISGVNTDHLGNLWVRTQGAGVVRIGGESVEGYTTQEGLLNNTPEGQVHGDATGGIWHAWIAHLGPDRRVFRIRNGARETVPITALVTVFVDREGSTWLGTASSGLLSAIHQDRRGRLWFGADAGLEVHADGRFTSYTTRDGLTHDHIVTLFEDREGAPSDRLVKLPV